MRFYTALRNEKNIFIGFSNKKIKSRILQEANIYGLFQVVEFLIKEIT
jgi:hypothetical protein